MKSLTDLKKLAEPVFKANPKVDKLLATSDGQFFLEKNKNAAEFHAKKKGGNQALRIYTIDRDGSIEDSNEDKDEQPAKLSAEERIEKINAMTSIEEVEAALVEEKAKTVKAAGLEKIEALKAAAGSEEGTEEN